MTIIKNRRDALKLAGLSLFAQSVFDQIYSQAFAAQLQRPRLVIYMSGNGLESRFVNRIKTQGTPGAMKFDLGEAFSPLKMFEDNLLIVKNTYNNISRDLHGMGFSSLTCAKDIGRQNQESGVPGGMSIDQYLKKEMNLKEPFSSLALGVKEGGAVKECLASGPGQVVTCGFDPMQSFERLFGASGQVNNAAAVETMAAADLQKQRQDRIAKKKKILDRVSQDVATLRTMMASSERGKLDQYLNSLEVMEKRLDMDSKGGASGDQANAVCNPVKPKSGSLDEIKYVVTENLNLTLAAFSCGLARSATHINSRGGQHQSYSPGNTPGLTASMNHHGDGAHMGLEEVKFIYRLHAQMIADFYGALQKIPEGSGTMADNTIVVWLSDNGGEHHTGNDNVPFFILAPKNGPLLVNRMIEFPSNKISTTKLWVSIAHAMGVKVNSFGDGTDPSDGPISEIMSS